MESDPASMAPMASGGPRPGGCRQEAESSNIDGPSSWQGVYAHVAMLVNDRPVPSLDLCEGDHRNGASCKEEGSMVLEGEPHKNTLWGCGMCPLYTLGGPTGAAKA